MKKYLFGFVAMFLFFTVFAAFAEASTHAIRPDCSNNGNGTTWGCATSGGATGAYNTIPSTQIRGDTYYFGDGTLTAPAAGFSMTTSESGTAKITFKKATASDYGGLSSWSSSYGDGQTVFVSGGHSKNTIFIYNTNGYYVFEGVTGTGNTQSSYGFLFRFGVTGASAGGDNTFFWHNGGSGSPSSEFYHTAFIGFGGASDTKCQSTFEGLGLASIIKNCLFYGQDNPIHNPDPITADGNVIDAHWSSPSCHGQVFSIYGSNAGANDPDFVIKNNLFLNCEGTGCISMNDARSDVSRPLYNLKIYNNIFLNVNAGALLQDSSSTVNGKNQGIRNSTFYHNTVIDSGAKIYTGSESSGNTYYNNLYYNSSVPDSVAVGWTHDYNYYDSTCTNVPYEAHKKTETVSKTTLFSNPSVYDFRIKKSDSLAINSGTALSAEYSTDKDGNTRSGSWDIGAYEYNSGGTCTPNWTCGAWSTCVNSSQTRTCTDANNCGVTTGKPAESQSCTSTTKKGDLNTDNKVDITDLGIFLSNWGKTTKPASDINQDGRVDVTDLGILLSNWG